MREIELERGRIAQRKLTLDRVGITGSILFFLLAVLLYGQVIVESEFWELASLAFSDLGIIAQNWNKFAYSLMETLPVMYLAIILAPVFFLFLFSSSYLSSNNHNSYRGHA